MYNEYKDQLTGRCEDSRKIHNNTYLKRRGNDIAIMLHDTDIILFKPSGACVLNTGGWKTVTTKARINEYSPAQVYQKASIWYITQPGQDCVFFDGVTINKDGSVRNPKYKDLKTTRTVKQINRYCKKIKDRKKLPAPNGGDCWNCLLFDQNLKSGEKSTSNDHLINHIKQGYIHGSLILNALRWAGYRDPGFIFQMDIRDSIVNAVRRYLKACLL